MASKTAPVGQVAWATVIGSTTAGSLISVMP